MKREVLLIAAMTLASCQSGKPAGDVKGPSVRGDKSALSTMERVALGANECWYKRGDPAFKGTKFSPELSSYSGKPRILVVPGKNIGGLPSLVVEATGNPARLSAYGPMMQGPHAGKITEDVNRWAGGTKSCRAA